MWDAQGNVLSTYEKRGNSPLEQTELHLYGSSRLGIQRTGGLVVEGSLVSPFTTETLVRGRKLYELSNHLGNVLATITDKKVLVADGGSAGGTGGICANGGLVEVLDLYNRDGSLSSYRARQEINFYSDFESGSSDEWEGYIDAGATLCDNNGGGGTGSSMPAGAYYVADLVSATDYAPFGMGLVGRTYNAGAYKYGFNGKEDDKDISEGGQDYGMRIYDTRLGKFLSVDPITKEYPELTPYQFASNMPVWAIDIDGLEAAIPDINKAPILKNVSESTCIGCSGRSATVAYATAMNRKREELDKLKAEYEQWSRNPQNIGKPVPSQFQKVAIQPSRVMEIKEGGYLGTKEGQIQKERMKAAYTVSQYLPVTGDLHDIKDVVTNVSKGDFVAAGLAAVFLIPGTDALKPIKSLVKTDKQLLKFAKETFQGNKSLSKEATELVDKFRKGLDGGIGSHEVFKGVSELRGRQGSRVYYRETKEGIEILGYSNKGNQQQVIDRLKSIYEK